MPIYDYFCDCGFELEVIQLNGEKQHICPKCGSGLRRRFPTPAMVKMDGLYPARKKFVDGSAPGATSDVSPWGSYNPSKPKWMSSGARKRQLRVDEVEDLGRLGE